MSKLLTQPGDTLTEGFGPDLANPTLLVTMTLDLDGLSFYVTDGIQRVDGLCKTYTVREQAIAFYRHIRDAAMQGKRIHQIVAEVQALQEAQSAATRSVEEIAGALNADVDAAQTLHVAEHNRVVGIVAEVMDGADPNWRRKVREQARQDAPRRIYPTRTGVHRKPLTAVELELVRNNVDGVVTTKPGQSWTVLWAIYQRIGGTPTYRPGTRIIASLTLNARGMAVAAEQIGVAA